MPCVIEFPSRARLIREFTIFRIPLGSLLCHNNLYRMLVMPPATGGTRAGDID